MAPQGDPQILNVQLQSILEVANKTFSAEQTQLLAGEIRRAMNNTVAGPSVPRKRKVIHCDGANCGPPSPTKSRKQTPAGDVDTDLAAGKFMCEACSQWVALKDESGYTLAPWVAHLLVCGQDELGSVNNAGTAEEHISGQSSASPDATSSSASGHRDAGYLSISAQSNCQVITERKIHPKSDTQAVSKDESSVESPTTPWSTSSDKPSTTLSHLSQAVTHIPHLPVAVNRTAFTTSLPLDSGARKQRRPNRTEAERVDEFKADPLVAEFEPFRVRCAVCNKWIRLRMNSRYCSIPWNCHKATCIKNNGTPSGTSNQSSRDPASNMLPPTNVHASGSSPNGPSSRAPSLTGPPFTATAISVSNDHANLPSTSKRSSPQQNPESSQSQDLLLIASSSGVPHPNKAAHHARSTEAEQRRAALLADLHTEIVEPGRILCSLCKKWVKLRPNSSYCFAPWRSHIQRCVAKKKRQEVRSMDTPFTRDPLMRRPWAPGADEPDPPVETRRSDYYRKNYEDPLDPRFNDGQVRTSYYKTRPITPQGSPTTVAQPVGRRGRPPKKRTPESMDCSAKRSDSEMSYESEEA